MGWCGITQVDSPALPDIWKEFQIIAKDQRQHYIKQNTFNNLRRQSNKFDHYSLHDILSSTIADSTKFLPSQPAGSKSKPHIGLGPLCVQPRSQADLHTHNNQMQMLTLGHALLSDVEDSKPPAPKPPSTVMELEELLHKYSLLLQELFLPTSPIAKEVGKVYTALEETRDFRNCPQFIPHVLSDIHDAITKYFTNWCSWQDLQQQTRMPTMDLNQLVTAIRGQSFLPRANLLHIYSLPANTPAPAPHQHHQDHNHQGNNRRNRGTSQTQQRSGHRNRNQHYDNSLRTLLNSWKDSHNRYPTLKELLPLTPYKTADATLTAYGMDTTNCLRYALLGACTHPSCTRNHTSIPKAKLNLAQSDLATALDKLK